MQAGWPGYLTQQYAAPDWAHAVSAAAVQIMRAALCPRPSTLQ